MHRAMHGSHSGVWQEKGRASASDVEATQSHGRRSLSQSLLVLKYRRVALCFRKTRRVQRDAAHSQAAIAHWQRERSPPQPEASLNFSTHGYSQP